MVALTDQQQEQAASCYGLAIKIGSDYARQRGLEVGECVSHSLYHLCLVVRKFDKSRGDGSQLHLAGFVRRSLVVRMRNPWQRGAYQQRRFEEGMVRDSDTRCVLSSSRVTR